MLLSRSVFLVFSAFIPLSLTQVVGDELIVAFQTGTVDYNSDGSSGESCKEELISNMAKQFLKYMDKTIDPCDNLYNYVCGNFQQSPVSGPKPPHFIDDQLKTHFERIVSKFLMKPLGENYDLGDAGIKARVFYKTCLDIDTMRQRGVEPFKEYIKEFGGWEVFTDTHTRKEGNFDIIEVLGKLSHLRSHTILGVTIGSKKAGDDVVVISAGESYLSTYSFNNSSKVAELKKFFEKILIMAGAPPKIANETSENVTKLEIEISKLQFHPKSTERERSLTLGELEAEISNFDWARLLTVVFDQRLGSQQRVLLKDKNYFSRLPVLLQNTPKKILADYIFLKTLILLSPSLVTGFEKIENSFRKFVTPQELEESCEGGAKALFSDVLAAQFAKTYFKNATKVEVGNMAERLRNTFSKTIDENSWLDTETKMLIRKLLGEMELKIGHFGERFSESALNKKYKDLSIIPEKFFESFLNALKKVVFDELKSINELPKLEDFRIAPTKSGALYDRIKNEVVIEAATLQPPYYYSHFPEALSFGAIGWVIGHEIAHSLDNNGTWTQENITVYSNWTKSSAETFDKLAECFVDQYDSYSMSVDGTATLEENIADTTGIRIAFKAYLEELAQNSSEDNFTLLGFNMTDRQLFFLSFAHSWCSESSKSSVKNPISNDFHSPSEFRVIAALSNIEEFAEAYNCPVGSNMNPTNKCVIW